MSVSVDLDSTPYRGRTSRPSTVAPATEPACTGCGSPLTGRLEAVRRGKGFELHIWRCRCGRRRRLRRAVAPG